MQFQQETHLVASGFRWFAPFNFTTPIPPWTPPTNMYVCFFQGRNSSHLPLTKHRVLGGLRKCYWKSKQNESVSPKKQMDIHNKKNCTNRLLQTVFNRIWTLHESKSRWWRGYFLASSLLVCVVSQNVGEKNPSEPRCLQEIPSLVDSIIADGGKIGGSTTPKMAHKYSVSRGFVVKC